MFVGRRSLASTERCTNKTKYDSCTSESTVFLFLSFHRALHLCIVLLCFVIHRTRGECTSDSKIMLWAIFFLKEKATVIGFRWVLLTHIYLSTLLDLNNWTDLGQNLADVMQKTPSRVFCILLIADST